MKTDCKKINIFVKSGNNWVYASSTTWAKTCKEAKQRYAEKYDYPLDEIRCNFAKDGK